jgi:hypothetical protein
LHFAVAVIERARLSEVKMDAKFGSPLVSYLCDSRSDVLRASEEAASNIFALWPQGSKRCYSGKAFVAGKQIEKSHQTGKYPDHSSAPNQRPVHSHSQSKRLQVEMMNDRAIVP